MRDGSLMAAGLTGSNNVLVILVGNTTAGVDDSGRFCEPAHVPVEDNRQPSFASCESAVEARSRRGRSVPLRCFDTAASRASFESGLRHFVWSDRMTEAREARQPRTEFPKDKIDELAFLKDAFK